ncbi:MAG TPA: exodeoxyribonuclease VII large subunit [bacterium]|nr:exodeoxyribonuclease VII large subunit [bacterium]
MDEEEEPSSSGKRVYSISELTREIKMTLEGFPPIWAEGEISNFTRHSSGHLYFSMKDSGAQIACVVWRGRAGSFRFVPEDGMKVIVMGRLSVYERQGRYQLIIERIQPAGQGDLQRAFEALKRKLAAEGLFDASRKKPIPRFPDTVGVVTSPTGAAVRDIVSVIRRRFPSVHMILRPVAVQGENAALDIARAIDEMNAFGKVDVMIVGRGGGSLEDLWAFNEEPVARAIHRSVIPVISAVGHEIDFSISDFTADLRAPTPSAAAELAVRDRSECLDMVNERTGRLLRNHGQRLRRHREKFESVVKRYGMRRPRALIQEYCLKLDDVWQSLRQAALQRYSVEQKAVEALEGRLKALNPLAVLERGYSIATRVRDGKVLTRSSSVEVQEAVHIRLARGGIRGVVQEIEDESR